MHNVARRGLTADGLGGYTCLPLLAAGAYASALSSRTRALIRNALIMNTKPHKIHARAAMPLVALIAWFALSLPGQSDAQTTEPFRFTGTSIDGLTYTLRAGTAYREFRNSDGSGNIALPDATAATGGTAVDGDDYRITVDGDVLAAGDAYPFVPNINVPTWSNDDNVINFRAPGSGTVSADDIGAYQVIWEVTNDGGTSYALAQTFTINILPAFFFPTVAQSFVAFPLNVLVSYELMPVTADGIVGTVAYTLAPIAPATDGFSITLNDIAGIPTVEADAPSSAIAFTAYELTATDDADSATATLTYMLGVFDAWDTSSSSLAVTFTTANAVLSYSTGGTVYDISNLTLPAPAALPPSFTSPRDFTDQFVNSGLAFSQGDSTTLEGIRVSDIDPAVRNVDFEFEGSIQIQMNSDVDTPGNPGGVIGAFTFKANFAPAVTFSVEPTALTVKLGLPGESANVDKTIPLRAAGGGVGSLVYAVADTLETNFAFDPATRTFTAKAVHGTNTPGSYFYTMTATDSHGAFAELRFVIEVIELQFDDDSQNPDALSYTVNDSGKMITFSALADGATGTAALLTTDITASNTLAFDATNRILSGGFTAVSGEVTLSYIITETTGGASAIHTFTIYAAPAPVYTATVLTVQLADNAANTTTLPDPDTGGIAPFTFSVTDGTLPPGVTLESPNLLVGSPPLGEASVSFTATDSNGSSAEGNFVVEVVTAPQFTREDDVATFTVGSSTYVLNGNTGVTGDIPPAALVVGTGVRPVEEVSTDNLSDSRGLTFDASTGVGGTPTTYGNFTYQLVATDKATQPRAATHTLLIRVNELPTFAVQENLSFTIDHPFDVTLASPDGGTAPFSYALQGQLPEGVNFDGNTGRVYGNALKVGGTGYILTAVDANDVAVAANGAFGIDVFPAPGFDVSHPDVSFTVNQPDGITVTLSPVDESMHAAPLTYTISVGDYTAPYQFAAANDSDVRNGRVTFYLTEADKTAGIGFALEGNDGTYTLTAPKEILTIKDEENEKEDDFVQTIEVGMTVADGNGVEGFDDFLIEFVAGPMLAKRVYEIDLGNYELEVDYAWTFPVADGGGVATYSYTYEAVPTDEKGNPIFVLNDEGNRKLDAEGVTVVDADGNPGVLDNPDWVFKNVVHNDQDPAVLTIRVTQTIIDDLREQIKNNTVTKLPDWAYYQYTITDDNNATTTHTLTIKPLLSTDEDLMRLNELILPRITAAIISDTIGVISGRIAQLRSGTHRTPQVSLAGQNSIAGIAMAHGQSLADDRMDFADLLNNASVNMPLGVAGGADSYRAPGGFAMWMSARYRALRGDEQDLIWDGDLRNLYVGVDGAFTNSTLFGLAIGWSDSTVDYTGRKELIGLGDGKYTVDLVSMHPYLSWQAKHLDLWLSVGYGSGELERTAKTDVSETKTTDIFMQNAALGASGSIRDYGVIDMRLKGEVVSTRMEIDEADGFPEQAINTGLSRMSLSISQSHLTSNGGRYEPGFEFGWRQAHGDGGSDGALEASTGMRFADASTRRSGELRAHGAWAADGEYEEWGVYAQFRNQPGADGQGFSVSLTPTYGELAERNVWDNPLTDLTATPDDYAMQVDARVGYGLSGVGGVLTPFGEWSHRANDTWRLGLDWSPKRDFVLNLVGEYESLDSGDAEQSVLLRGKVAF